MAEQLTHTTLLSLLKYNPKTGIFTWRRNNSRRRVGDRAGGVGAKGYWMIGISDKRYYAHVLAWFYMTGEKPVMGIDHRDGNGMNNRWRNLRLATKRQNAANAKLPSTNTSGYKGVSWNRKLHKWHVTIRREGKSTYLGLFLSPKAAARAYRDAALRIHGQFVRELI